MIAKLSKIEFVGETLPNQLSAFPGLHSAQSVHKTQIFGWFSIETKAWACGAAYGRTSLRKTGQGTADAQEVALRA